MDNIHTGWLTTLNSTRMSRNDAIDTGRNRKKTGVVALFAQSHSGARWPNRQLITNEI